MFWCQGCGRIFCREDCSLAFPATSPQRKKIAVEKARCPFCHEDIETAVAQLACNSCRAWHHQECWAEGGNKCSACKENKTGIESEKSGSTSQEIDSENMADDDPLEDEIKYWRDLKTKEQAKDKRTLERLRKEYRIGFQHE